MKRNFTRVLIVLAVMSFIIFWQFYQKDKFYYKGQVQKITLLSIGQSTITAFVADTLESREKGLGGITGLSPERGMFFVFGLPARYGIWMKDMKFPIDIVWLRETRINTDKDSSINPDKKGRLVIVDMKEGVLPSSYPEVFTPELPAEYVLETAAGFVAENNLKIGDEIYFSEDD